MWNDRFAGFGEFPFRRLHAALDGLEPPAGKTVLDFSIGEPKHAPPALLAKTVAAHADQWNRYPPPAGTPVYREAVAGWLCRRYAIPETAIDPMRNVLPLVGTKEGLFLLATIAVPESKDGRRPAVLMPSPLYAVYLGAAAMAGAEPVLLPASRETGFMPDLDALSPELLRRTAAFYLCSPGNPQGAIADTAYLRRLIQLAREYDFLLIADECYSEIYDDTPPPGALETAWSLDGSFANVVSCSSLSKRSNAAGLRAGFVAGDADVLSLFLKLRAYGAAVQPLPLMAAAGALWNDETHVIANRDLYRAKLDVAEARIGNRFGFYRPPGGFFLWLDVGDGVRAARELWTRAGLKVLPGAYLTPGDEGPGNPGQRYIRMALVHDAPLVGEALERLIDTLS